MNRAKLVELDIKPDAVYLVHLIARSGMSKSNGEARKLITAGGVTLDGSKITDTNCEFPVDREIVLKVGKRRFLRLTKD